MFTGIFHVPMTTGTGALVPYLDVGTAAAEAETAYLTAERGGYIGDDTANYNVLYRVAVWAKHRTDLLAEQTTTLVDIGFITA